VARKSTEVIPKKRGPPGKGKDPLIALRMPPDERQAIEDWAAKQPDNPSLSLALRRLAQRGLASDSADAKPRRVKRKAD
jgi:hypothetical protein